MNDTDDDSFSVSFCYFWTSLRCPLTFVYPYCCISSIPRYRLPLSYPICSLTFVPSFVSLPVSVQHGHKHVLTDPSDEGKGKQPRMSGETSSFLHMSSADENAAHLCNRPML